MRKATMITSCISFILLSVSLIIILLTNPAELVWPTLPWFLSASLMIAGFIVMFVALICYTIYFYQQERAKERIFKRWQLSTRAISLLHSKAEEVKPYKREVWLQLALFISLGLVMMSSPAIELILLQIVPYSESPFEATLKLLFWPVAPASVFICTFLSKDLASQNGKKP